MQSVARSLGKSSLLLGSSRRATSAWRNNVVIIRNDAARQVTSKAHGNGSNVGAATAKLEEASPLNGVASGDEEPLTFRASPAGELTEEQKLLAGVENPDLKDLLRVVLRRNPSQPEFLDAVKEVVTSLQPVFNRHPDLLPIFAQMCEPERQIMFRVPWLDDNNQIQVSRGFRVQLSSAIGPYKGGLRFHPSVNISIIKMLAFEQAFKNALTGLALGAGKGGADFDPKGRSDGEIQRFCQSFMTELFRHIADDVDVPAGDIGVGGKEIGYLFGQYKRLSGQFQGALTGKGVQYGGSMGRPEATGYGTVLFAQELLKDKFEGDTLQNKRCLVSGSGNVAIFCALKLLACGAKVLSISDSKGCLVEPEGFNKDQLLQVQRIKAARGTLAEFFSPTAKYFGEGTRPWGLAEVGSVDLAFPCATQNELDDVDAEALASKGCRAVFEGANMPATAAAVERLAEKKVIHVPGKMANAGGVAVSGLEMAQNRTMDVWTEQVVFDRLENIMKDIYWSSKKASEEYDVDLGSGGNIAAFLKLAEAVRAQGAV